MLSEIEKVVVIADLVDSFCELNHGPNTKSSDFPATNALVVPIGYRESTNIDVAKRNYTIPICNECALGLEGNEWVLLYCLECNKSQWIAREKAKNKYHPDDHIIWKIGCHNCGGMFVTTGTYFQRGIL